MTSLENPAIKFLDDRIRAKGSHIHLTGSEFNLLTKLFQNAGKICSKVFLLGALNEHSFYELSSVDRYIAQLRNKLEDDPHQPAFIKDVGDKGYILYLLGYDKSDEYLEGASLTT